MNVKHWNAGSNTVTTDNTYLIIPYIPHITYNLKDVSIEILKQVCVYEIVFPQQGSPILRDHDLLN